MTQILSPLINEDIDRRYSRIYVPFEIFIETLKSKVVIPAGFIHDYESVPVVKGTSKVGGVVHDYFCRINSIPVVTKKKAAEIYLEVMESQDNKYTNKDVHGLLKKVRLLLTKANLFSRRWVKYGVVLVAWGYFHKHRVEITYDELTDKNGAMFFTT